jgi:hypothetical protein
MFWKLLLASVATIGLLLAGPQKASAQTISACVNSATGLLYVVAANTSCPPSSGNVTWTKITLGTTPGGALAGAAYQCVSQQTIAAGGALNFSSSGVSFGSAISTSGSTFGSFVLQAGTYQINLSGLDFVSQTTGQFSIVADLNNAATTTSWLTQNSIGPTTFDIVGGERFISVASNNTTLQFIPDAPKGIAITGPCWLTIAKLQ